MTVSRWRWPTSALKMRGVTADSTASRSRRPARRASAPSARLTVVFPTACAGAYPVGREPVVVGREAEGGITVRDASVSRRHAEFVWDEAVGAHGVRDLGSKHGTRVDGVELEDEPAPLANGSVVRLADVVLVYETGKVEPIASTEALPGAALGVALLRTQLAKAAPDAAPVTILGETGAGKEMVAAEVHRLSGRKGPYVTVNCAALSAQLVESQLFGHTKGAFTGADAVHQGLFRAAAGGTLFLDEIGELPLDVQPKLLRVLQQREVMPVGATQAVKVDVRVVAATNRSLAAEVEAGRFRRDLYARLALWELRVPPLRDRKVDLLMWLELLYAKWKGEGRPPLPPLEPEAVEALLLARWPENLRTLDRLVHALGSSGAPEAVAAEGLPPWIGTMEQEEPLEREAPSAVAAPAAPRARRASPSKEELLAALEKHQSVRATAKHFGRDRRQIYRWIEAHGLTWKD